MSRLTLPSHVTVVEVGPRDGLQNEAVLLPTAVKLAYIDALADAGLPVIEATAFVNPNRVPQMSDAAVVARAVAGRPRPRFTALVPNLKGLDAARSSGLREVAIFAAASETFSQRNINQSIGEALETYAAVTAEAIRSGLRVRGYLSTVFGCPYEGNVPITRVVDMSRRLTDMGVFEVALSDTIGVATPGQVMDVVDAVALEIPRAQIALHLHDTRGTALANVLAGLQAGVTTFDAAAGGLGGCPFAPGAAGNLSTEDLVYMLNGLGVTTWIDLPRLVEASRIIAPHLGHPLPSRYLRSAAPAPPPAI